jgi:hypothetical protein
MVQSASPGVILRASNAAASMVTALAPFAVYPLCLPMTVLQAAGVSKVPGEHECPPSAPLFGRDAPRSARSSPGGKAWSRERDVGTLQLNIERA